MRTLNGLLDASLRQHACETATTFVLGYRWDGWQPRGGKLDYWQLLGGALQLRLPGAAVGSGLLDMVMSEALEPPQLRVVVERLLAALSRLAERGGAATAPGVEPLTDSDEALGFAMPGVRRSTVRSVLIETPLQSAERTP